MANWNYMANWSEIQTWDNLGILNNFSKDLAIIKLLFPGLVFSILLCWCRWKSEEIKTLEKKMFEARTLERNMNYRLHRENLEEWIDSINSKNFFYKDPAWLCYSVLENGGDRTNHDYSVSLTNVPCTEKVEELLINKQSKK